MSDPIPMRPLPARRPPHYHADELIAGAIVVERRRLHPLTEPVSDLGSLRAAAVALVEGIRTGAFPPEEHRRTLVQAAAFLLLEIERTDTLAAAGKR